MTFWETILAERSEVLRVTPHSTASEIKNKIEVESAPTIFTIVANKLLGKVDTNILSLKLGLNNFFLFLPTAYCNLSELVKNRPIDITLKYSESNKTLMRTWFFISHGAVIFWLSYFLLNLFKGRSSIPFTWNEQEGYFLNNYVLLTVSVVIWICFILLPVMVSWYCWKRTVTLVHEFFER